MNPSITKWLNQCLKKSGINQSDLRAEMLDHYLTEYEKQLGLGDTEKAAKQHIKTEIQQSNLKELNRQIFLINHKKSLTMTASLFSIFTFCCFYLFTSPSILDQDPPSIWPVKASTEDIYSGFGMRTHPLKKLKQLHKGIDIKLPIGTDIFATADGLVIKAAKHKSGYGNHVIIDHGDGYQTLYAHMHEISVTKGDTIKLGSTIGTVGASGMSIAPHLHYEVLKDGKAVNPMSYLVP